MSSSSSPIIKNLYRIVGFERAVQLLESNEMYFSHPSIWDDPYDQGVSHKRSLDIFAQCWCRKAVSDAMWRIYSPNNLGVRIGTTLDRIKTALSSAKEEQRIEFKIQDIKYLHQEELHLQLEKLEKKRKAKPSFSTTIAPLFLKRNAFDHELETRVVVYHPSQNDDPPRKGVAIKVKSRDLVRSIWIDPRAPKEYAEAYANYLKNVLKFEGTVKQSSLYATRDPKGE